MNQTVIKDDLFEALKDKEYRLELPVSNVSHDIGLTGLKNLLKEDFILAQQADGSYRIAKYIDGVVHQYRFKVGNSDPQINLTSKIVEFLMTGTITSFDTGGNTDIHNLPLPMYTVETFDGDFSPVVKLKNGKKALLTSDGIVEGVQMD